MAPFGAVTSAGLQCEPASCTTQDLLLAGEVALATPENLSLIPGTCGTQEQGNEHDLKVGKG